MRPYCDFDWTLTRTANAARGFVPGRALVVGSRAPMVLLGALAVLGIYGVGASRSGRIVGWIVASGLALGSPLAQEYLPRVVPEGLLILSLTACLVFTNLGMRRARDGRIALRWALAVGVMAGLGLAAKLTASLSLVAFLAWSALIAAAAIRSRRPESRARPLRWSGPRSEAGCWPRRSQSSSSP